ncbi:MAG: hypothetical protein JWM11_2159 [Planctomycetaceae bacterium]|nr:hypothetical protein [Planctomycetaceae bacterium]
MCFTPRSRRNSPLESRLQPARTGLVESHAPPIGFEVALVFDFTPKGFHNKAQGSPRTRGVPWVMRYWKCCTLKGFHNRAL